MAGIVGTAPGGISIGLTNFSHDIGRVVSVELLRVKNLRDELDVAIQMAARDYINSTRAALRDAVKRLDEALQRHQDQHG